MGKQKLLTVSFCLSIPGLSTTKRRGKIHVKFLSILKVLEHTGGPTGLQDVLFRAGQPFPTLQRINNWRVRQTLPHPWPGAIIWALACAGVNPLDLLDDASSVSSATNDTEEDV